MLEQAVRVEVLSEVEADESIRASVWSRASCSRAISGSIPAKPISVGMRSAWFVGMSTSRAPPLIIGPATTNGTWMDSS